MPVQTPRRLGRAGAVQHQFLIDRLRAVAAYDGTPTLFQFHVMATHPFGAHPSYAQGYYDRDNRREAAIDLQFLAGDQWPEYARAQRVNRPMLTINKIPSYLHQITNDIRQNRPGIKVHPVDDGADREQRRGDAEDELLRQERDELAGDDGQKMQKLLDMLEDLDDVQDVFHNAEIAE